MPRNWCGAVVVVLSLLVAAASADKYLLGIEGYCLNECSQLRLDLVRCDLPTPRSPEHLFTVVEPRLQAYTMTLARFDAYDPVNQVYYLITQDPANNAYELFAADVTTSTTTNMTLQMPGKNNILSSIQWDTATGQLFAVVNRAMLVINVETGIATFHYQILDWDNAHYMPMRQSFLRTDTRDYYFTVYDMDKDLYSLVTFNLGTNATTISGHIGGEDPSGKAEPLEITYVPSLELVYVLVVNKLGGGMLSVDPASGDSKFVVNLGEFDTPYDVDTDLENADKNQEAAFDPEENYWYLEMFDYTDPEMPSEVVVPWEVQHGWLGGASSLSDDVSNWQFVSN